MKLFSTQCTVDTVNLALLQVCYPNVKEIDVQFIGVWPNRDSYVTGVRAIFDGVTIELRYPHNNTHVALRFVESEQEDAAETLLTDALVNCAEWVRGEIKELTQRQGVQWDVNVNHVTLTHMPSGKQAVYRRDAVDLLGLRETFSGYEMPEDFYQAVAAIWNQ